MGNPFKSPKKPKPPPPPEPDPVIPEADSQAVETDKKRAAATRAKRYGRASTILTDDKLGG